MGSVVSKRRVRTLLLIIPRVAPGVSHQGDTASAPAVHRELGRPAAAHDWEEGACDQAKGWGECPADRRSGAPVASSLSARSARPTPPVLAGAPTDALISWLRGWVERVI